MQKIVITYKRLFAHKSSGNALKLHDDMIYDCYDIQRRSPLGPCSAHTQNGEKSHFIGTNIIILRKRYTFVYSLMKKMKYN